MDDTTQPLSDITVHAGFPNPATDSDRTSHGLSLDQLLLGRPSSTYMFRLRGHSWVREGIADGDIAVVDRSRPSRAGSLVVAWDDDEFLLVRRQQLPHHLAPWGVVTAVVHLYESAES